MKPSLVALVSIFVVTILATICIVFFIPRYNKQQEGPTVLPILDLSSTKHAFLQGVSELNIICTNASMAMFPQGIGSFNLTMTEVALCTLVVGLSATFCVSCISDIFSAVFFHSAPGSQLPVKGAGPPPPPKQTTTQTLSLTDLSPSVFLSYVYVVLFTIMLIIPGPVYFMYVLPQLFRPWYDDSFVFDASYKDMTFRLATHAFLSGLIQYVAHSLVRRRGIFSDLVHRYILLVPANLALGIFMNGFGAKNLIETGAFLLSSLILYANESSAIQLRRKSYVNIVLVNLLFGSIFFIVMCILDYAWGRSLVCNKIQTLTNLYKNKP